MRLHIEFFEPVMDPLIVFASEDSIAFRIVAGPSIEMDRGVVRVGRVTYVMAQDACVVDDSLFDPFTLVRIALGAPQAELDAQALKQFEDAERDEACGRGLLSGLDQFGGELVTVDCVEGGRRNQFEVEEVVGRVGRIQRLVQVGFVAAAPAVRFGIEVAELIDRLAKKFRRLFWELHRRRAARQFVALRRPTMRVVQRLRQSDGYRQQTEQESCDLGSCSFHQIGDREMSDSVGCGTGSVSDLSSGKMRIDKAQVAYAPRTAPGTAQSE